MQLIIGLISLTGFVIALSLFVYGLIKGKRRNVLDRLKKLIDDETEEENVEPLSVPFYDRVVMPIFISIGDFFTRLTPSRISSNIEDKMWLAGYTDKDRVNKFFTIQSIWLIALPATVGMLLYLLQMPWGKILPLMILTAVFSIIYPILRVNSRVIARKECIKRDLPNAIDLLVVSVEAGLGFDMAVEKVTEKISGPLAQEFGYTLNEIRMGKSRAAAFRELGVRTKVDELASFIGAIIQADQLGVSIGSVLRIQADAMRIRRRQSIEETSMKAPIKMLFPLIFFILPSIFVVILGPAIINLIKIFAGMK